MKVVVTRWEDSQPIYNTRFLSFATHYGFIQYANNRYSVPWRLIGLQIPVRILEDTLEIFNASLDRVATHNLLRSRNGKQTDPSHLPPSDHAEQIALLREKLGRRGLSRRDHLCVLLCSLRSKRPAVLEVFRK